MPIQKIGMEWPSKVTNANDVIGQTVAAHGRQDSKRNSKTGTAENCDCGKFDGGGHDVGDVIDDRLAGADRHAEIAGQDIAEIAQELFVNGFIHAKRSATMR